MAITKEEREALFAEFEAQFGRKDGQFNGWATFHNMEPAKDHFWARYQFMTKSHEFDTWAQKGIRSIDWDLIRKLVCHANGKTIVRDIPFEKLNDANELAIKLIDLLFDYNEQILKEDGAV